MQIDFDYVSYKKKLESGPTLYYKWCIYVKASDMDLDQIEYVEYLLHPSFPDPKRIITDRSTKFKLEIEGVEDSAIFAI